MLRMGSTLSHMVSVNYVSATAEPVLGDYDHSGGSWHVTILQGL